MYKYWFLSMLLIFQYVYNNFDSTFAHYYLSLVSNIKINFAIEEVLQYIIIAYVKIKHTIPLKVSLLIYHIALFSHISIFVQSFGGSCANQI